MKVKHVLQPSALIAALILIAACGQPTATEDAASSEAAPVESTAEMSEAQAEAAPAAATAEEEPAASVEPAATEFPAEWTLPDVDTADPRWKQTLPKPAMLNFDQDKTYFWLLETNYGPMRFRLFDDSAPMHVSSTIYLTRLGFYDDVNFHRVIPGFMAQGGDPIGNGTGGPGYEYDGEFSAGLSHDRPGLLSMANRGPGTDGSQFFVTFVPTPFLDGKHTIFGELKDGAETLAALEARGSRGGATSETLTIERASISIE